jgi:hypothetical protein
LTIEPSKRRSWSDFPPEVLIALREYLNKRLEGMRRYDTITPANLHEVNFQNGKFSVLSELENAVNDSIKKHGTVPKPPD